ncbi:MAG TPA: histidine phosphatase family protein [Marmoricola sp.]|nr:histidine phosphatase family protein [Marmoricola sp.]
MSSLMCPATLVVARHGDAEYVERVFSDEGGTLTSAGRRQAAELAEHLAGRRIAHVWCSDAARAVQTAEIVAARFGVAVTTRKSLREVDVGDLAGQPFSVEAVCNVTDQWFRGDLAAAFPGGESGHDVVARYAAALAEIADLHRGETVVVVGHENAASISLPSLARTTAPTAGDRQRLDHCECAELVVDADDWVISSWGEPHSEPAQG